MPYSVIPGETVSDAVQRIAVEQIDRALAAIEDTAAPRLEAAYALRKRCKKIRAILRLARGPLDGEGLYKPANAALRDIAATFSGLRDADVVLDSYDRIMADAASETPDFNRRPFGPIRAQLTRRRNALVSGDERDLTVLLDEAHWQLLTFRLGIADWAFDIDGFAAIEPGFRKTYGRVLSSAEAAQEEGSVEAFHEWRKRVKYHRNHLRLLKKMAPRALNPRILSTWKLGDILGLDHDLAVIHDIVRDEPRFDRVQSRRRFLSIVARRRSGLQDAAFAFAEEIGFADEDTTVSRMAGLWNIGMNRPAAASLRV